jgi:hypothetical protein
MEGPGELKFPEIMLLLIHSKRFAATQTFYKITDSKNTQAMDLKVPLKATLKNYDVIMLLSTDLYRSNL